MQSKSLKMPWNLEAIQSTRYAVHLMLEFYRNVRADDCSFDMDGDMLLCQWGTYDWGKGRHFEFDLTRQFLESNDAGDTISQLRLTFHYAPSPVFEAFKPGNRWCGSVSGLSEFESFISCSPAYDAAIAATPLNATLTYGQT
jgi:uncharacterized protein (DUF2237 family)